MNWNAFFFALAGAGGFLLSLFLTALGESPSKIFSHVLANACAAEANLETVVGGMIAGVTVCVSAVFLYAFVRDLPSGGRLWTAVAACGHVAWLGFVALGWFSTRLRAAHRWSSGVAIFFSLAFAALLVYAKRRRGMVELAALGATFLGGLGMALGFAFGEVEGANLAFWDPWFFAFQIVYWMSFCAFVGTQAFENNKHHVL